MKAPTKESVDKLLDEWKARGQEVENLKTQIRNLENCVACIVKQYGDEEAEELTVSAEMLKWVAAPQGLGDFMLTWDHDKREGTYTIKLCRANGDS